LIETCPVILLLAGTGTPPPLKMPFVEIDSERCRHVGQIGLHGRTANVQSASMQFLEIGASSSSSKFYAVKRGRCLGVYLIVNDKWMGFEVHATRVFRLGKR
jgi:hypothetical protein